VGAHGAQADEADAISRHALGHFKPSRSSVS
jgi:hypothetical protein